MERDTRFPSLLKKLQVRRPDLRLSFKPVSGALTHPLELGFGVWKAPLLYRRRAQINQKLIKNERIRKS